METLSTSQDGMIRLIRTKQKFIMIKMVKKQKKLCAVDLQDEGNNAPPVFIKTKDNKQAFKFLHRKIWYWVTAKENKLHFVKDGDLKKNLLEPIWFEKVEMATRGYDGLQFVQNGTTWYLSNQAFSDKTQVLTFTKKSFECAPIRFENRN